MGGGIWTSGTQEGSGSTVVPSGATLTVGQPGNAVVLRGGRTLRTLLGGTVDWVNGEIYGGEDARIENAGDFLIHGSDGGLHGEIFGGPRVLIHNTGTFKKETGGGTTTVYAALDNDAPGTLTAANGTLALAGGSGTETCPEGTCPRISEGAYVAQAGALLSFIGGVHKIVGPVSGAGTVLVGAGEVSFGGPYDVSGTTELQGGTASFETTSSTGTLNQSGSAELGGSGALTVGAGTWTSGYQQGGGSTIVKSGATFHIGEVFFGAVGLRGGRTLATAVGGTIDWVTATSTAATARGSTTRATLLARRRGLLGDVLGATRILVHNTGTFTKETGT